MVVFYIHFRISFFYSPSPPKNKEKEKFSAYHIEPTAPIRRTIARPLIRKPNALVELDEVVVCQERDAVGDPSPFHALRI